MLRQPNINFMNLMCMIYGLLENLRNGYCKFVYLLSGVWLAAPRFRNICEICMQGFNCALKGCVFVFGFAMVSA